MTAMKVRNPVDGTWVIVPTVGPVGPEGPIGPQGPMGISTVIVGNFGINTTPADLPVDGLLPVDWDGPGSPSVAYQMEIGQSLYYEKDGDPIDGHLFQYVTTAVDATGWIDIGLIQGPQGEQGIQGPIGPTGPEGPIGPADDEVHIGPDIPPLVTQELWFDTDDARLLGPYNLPDGGLAYDALTKATDLDGDIAWRNVYSVPSGKVIQFPNAEGAKIHLYSTSFGFGITASTLDIFSNTNIRFKQNSITGTQWANIHSAGMEINAGHLYFPTDGHGVRFNGNAYIFKKSGGGLVIRKHSANTMVKIENNDGSNGKDIVVVGGGQSLGAQSNVEFSSHVVINGSNGSNSAHFYVNCATNDNAYYFNVLEARRLDNTTVFVLKGYQSSGGSPDCHAKMYVNLGTEGIDEVCQWADYGDGQVCVYSHGPMSSTHFQDRNRSAALAETIAPVDPALVGRLIDAVKPITFSRHFRSLTATDGNPEGFVRPHHDPIPTLGLDFGGVNGECGDLIERIIGSVGEGYSVGGVLAVAIAEIQQLRARLAVVEGKCA